MGAITVATLRTLRVGIVGVRATTVGSWDRMEGGSVRKLLRVVLVLIFVVILATVTLWIITEPGVIECMVACRWPGAAVGLAEGASAEP